MVSDLGFINIDMLRDLPPMKRREIVQRYQAWVKEQRKKDKDEADVVYSKLGIVNTNLIQRNLCRKVKYRMAISFKEPYYEEHFYTLSM